MYNLILSFFILLVSALPSYSAENKLSFETQALLNALGYKVGVVDGAFGKKSKAALSKFHLSQKVNSGPTPDEKSLILLKKVYFGDSVNDLNLSWNGNFIVPLDVLRQFSSANQVAINKSCGLNPNYHRTKINDELAKNVPLKITGFNSRMDNQASVKNADRLDLFVLNFSRLATSVISQRNEVDAELALKALYYWANGNAFLETVQCTKSGILDDKKCTEWTQPNGQDLSLIKDHGTVQMHMMHLSYGYYMTLSAYNKSDPRHLVIQKWFNSFFKRNKSPNKAYFGMDHGWFWPEIIQNQFQGKSSVKLVKKLLNQLDQEVFNDGSIKDRTTRGNKALWYHHDGMKEIMITLEIARRHGFEIPKNLEKKIEKAGAIFIRAFQDHSYLNKWAKVAHNAIYVPGEQDFTDDLANIPNGNSWFYIYAYRYPGSDVTRQLLKLLKTQPNNSPASKDAMIGFGLGCIYSSASEG